MKLNTSCMRILKIIIVALLCFFFVSKVYSFKGGEHKVSQNVCQNSTDTVRYNLSNNQTNTKGQFRFIISFPYINSFYLVPQNENIKNTIGFMGSTFGLDYFYDTNQYVNLSFSQILDYYNPLPIKNYGKIYETINSYYWGLSNNHKIKRFSLGYGFCFAKNSWELINNNWDENSSTRKPVTKTNYVVGLVFPIYFQITPAFYFGIIYRPTFLRVNVLPTYKYEHSISLDIGWKIPLNN